MLPLPYFGEKVKKKKKHKTGSLKEKLILNEYVSKIGDSV